MSELKSAINKAGGPAAAAKACGKSARAIYKWLAAGALPRTDFSGETDYAGRLAAPQPHAGSPSSASGCLRTPSRQKPHRRKGIRRWGRVRSWLHDKSGRAR